MIAGLPKRSQFKYLTVRLWAYFFSEQRDGVFSRRAFAPFDVADQFVLDQHITVLVQFRLGHPAHGLQGGIRRGEGVFPPAAIGAIQYRKIQIRLFGCQFVQFSPIPKGVDLADIVHPLRPFFT